MASIHTVQIQHDDTTFEVDIEVTPFVAPTFTDCNMTGPGELGGYTCMAIRMPGNQQDIEQFFDSHEARAIAELAAKKVEGMGQ